MTSLDLFLYLLSFIPISYRLDLNTYIQGDYSISDAVCPIFYFIKKYIMAFATANIFIINQSYLFCYYWSIVDLLCCINFRYITKWISYTYILWFFTFFSSIGHYRVLSRVPCAVQ